MGHQMNRPRTHGAEVRARMFFLFFTACLWMLCLSGCGAKRVPPQPLPSPSVDRSAIVRTALSQLGKPYHYGGESPETGFDCSGFTRWVYAQHGMTLPRRSQDQLRTGRKIDETQLKQADLVFFNPEEKGSLHVGIYVDGETFIHSPSSGGRVRKDKLSNRYWKKTFLEGRDVLP